MSEIIIGMNLAIEEEEGIAALETATSLKTALMGPFAGVSDVIFGVIAGTIFGAIGRQHGNSGSPVGMGIWVALEYRSPLHENQAFRPGLCSRR